MKLKISTEEFIERSKKIHGDKFDYSHTIYNGSSNKVQIKCNECNNFFNIRASLHSGNTSKTRMGCKSCTLEKRHSKRRTPLVDLIKYSSEKHNNKYIYCYDEDNYKGSRGNIKYFCKKCKNIVIQNVKSHKDGKGCSTCAKKGADYNKPGILYYLSINNGSHYKIGITGVSVENRFKNEPVQFKILKTWDFPLLRDALKKEQEIKKIYKKYITFDKILNDGNTELFSIDILSLDY